MYLFYSRDFTPAHPQLDEKECHHAVNVLRLQQGTPVSVSDGAGTIYVGTLQEISKKRCLVHVTAINPLAVNPAKGFHLAVSPTKSLDRMEWMVEKCTELGIESITFLKSRFSERKDINTAKLEAVAVAAMKQSQRAYLPALHPMIRLEDFLAQNTADHYFIADQYNAIPVAEWPSLISRNKNNCILIGPEGGFSAEEVILAQQNQAQAVSLGSYRLRTETAAVAACHLLNVSAV